MAFPSFIEFVEKQNRIYESIRNDGYSGIKSQGTIPHTMMTEEGVGAVGAFLKYSGEFTQRASEISTRVARLVPSLTYSQELIHTTLTDCNVQQGYERNLEDVGTMCSAVREITKVKPTMNFGRLLISRDSIILQVEPNKEFFYMVLELQKELRGKDIKDVRFPWGNHITISRFRSLQSKGDIQKSGLLSYYELERDSLRGTSTPFQIDVCTNRLNSREFSMEVERQFIF